MKLEITVENYITHVELSKKRRKKYYKKGDKLSKTIRKKISEGKYIWKDKLYDLENKEYVVKNPIAAGTPKLIPINGQLIWNSNVSKFTRNKVKTVMREFFTPYFEDLPKIDYQVKITIEYHNDIERDLDNMDLIYRKVILDIIKDYIIEDDSRAYFSEYTCKYIYSQNRKLIIRIYEN